jgi:hypothetical protein
VKGLVEAALVDVRPNHAYSEPMREPHHGPTVELDSFEEFEADLAEPMTELEDLVVEDRPVVMEDAEDALLPEPLPGEGVAFEGELLEGAVDRRTFDSGGTPEERLDSFGDDRSDHEVEPIATAVPDAVTTLNEHFESVVDHAHPGIDGALNPAAEADAFEAELAAAEGGVESPSGEDDERGSLLRFLSSVKP